jgi:ABC-type multidrug transport system fused ATPase/permease subunit
MLRTFWRFRRTVRPYRAPLAVGSALVLVVAATDIAAPWPLKVIVDNVLRGQEPSGVVAELFTWMVGSGREPLLAAAIVGLLALTIINATADYLSTYVLDGIGQRLMADLRNAIFAHLQRQSLHYHDRQRVGDLTTRITSDVSQVQDMLVTSLSVLIPNVTVLLGIVVVMFVVDAEFALLALAVARVLPGALDAAAGIAGVALMAIYAFRSIRSGQLDPGRHPGAPSPLGVTDLGVPPAHGGHHHHGGHHAGATAAGSATSVAASAAGTVR